VVALGTRLDGMTTRGYSLVEAPRPRQRLAHVYPAADELGTIYQPDLAVVSSPGAMLRALAASPPAGAGPWAEWTAAARREHLANSVPQAQPGDLNLGEVVRTLRGRLPDDAVVTNGAGNFSGWVSRHFEFRQPATQLAPQSGSMGYGLPAALAAKAARPESPAICVAGDGDFLMYASELSTAVQHGLSILVLVVNNGMYGTIRMHQEREHPGRTIATDIADPDFVALARSFGVFGELVERTYEFPPALERALACGGPALIELRVDPDAISHRTTLSEIRASAGS
jgi:acetolactate synthase I/II/III large subunit